MRRNHADGAVHVLAAFVAACAFGIASAAPESGRSEQDVLEISLGQAVLMALTNNQALNVQRLNPLIQRTFEEQERALFDPRLSGEVLDEQMQTTPSSISNGVVDDAATTTVGGSLSVTEVLPTGTALDIALKTQKENGGEDLYSTTAEIGVTQALLQGRPIAVNLASLHQARLDTEISAYELSGFAETLVADVESAYWDCSLADRRLQIVRESLDIAEQQLNEIEHRIQVGSLPETELAAARAETALRREALINARSALSTANLRLLQLTDPDSLAGPRKTPVLTTGPAVPEIDLGSLESHVALAMQMRPDLNQARLEVKKGDLELVRTRNGLLPKMDLFIRLGQTGYAAAFGDSADGIDGHDLDVSAGIRLEFPIGNRDAKARHRRALFTQEQTAEALKNLASLVRVDVEAGYIEVERTREQVSATATTQKFQEEKVRAEMAKFNVGRSTSLLLAQTQRDLLVSQVSAVDAVVKHLKALVALFRLEGSLLDRRGLSVPDR